MIYQRRASPLHATRAAVASAWCVVVAGVALSFEHPLLLGALLDEQGQVERMLGPGGGLVAATRMGGEAPTWIVTGTDEVGLAAAAAQLQEDALRNHFAIAVEDGRPTPLPLLPPPETP